MDRSRERVIYPQYWLALLDSDNKSGDEIPFIPVGLKTIRPLLASLQSKIEVNQLMQRGNQVLKAIAWAALLALYSIYLTPCNQRLEQETPEQETTIEYIVRYLGCTNSTILILDKDHSNHYLCQVVSREYDKFFDSVYSN